MQYWNPGCAPCHRQACAVCLLRMQAVGVLMLMSELAGDGYCSNTSLCSFQQPTIQVDALRAAVFVVVM